jgi:hypothetical protein
MRALSTRHGAVLNGKRLSNKPPMISNIEDKNGNTELWSQIAANLN